MSEQVLSEQVPHAVKCALYQGPTLRATAGSLRAAASSSSSSSSLSFLASRPLSQAPCYHARLEGSSDLVLSVAGPAPVSKCLAYGRPQWPSIGQGQEKAHRLNAVFPLMVRVRCDAVTAKSRHVHVLCCCQSVFEVWNLHCFRLCVPISVQVLR